MCCFATLPYCTLPPTMKKPGANRVWRASLVLRSPALWR